jgi:hypothetical protein
MYFPSNHQIQFGLDWNPFVIEGRLLFQIQINKRLVDVPIDLRRLNPTERQQLDEFMHRQQTHSLTEYEVVRGAAWILDTMLVQEHPSLTKIARDARVWVILGIEDPPSFKEPYFAQAGKTFLQWNRSEQEFEDAKKMRHFNKIFLSWRRAIYRVNFGAPLPRNFRVHSPVEADELELLSYALQFEPDLARVYQIFAPVMARYGGNSSFSRWRDRIIERRGKSERTRLGLDYWLLCGWIHGFMWGFSNHDRMQILVRMSGMFPGTEKWANVHLSPELIKMTARRRGLLGWSDFPQTYPKAPWTLDLTDRP